MQFWIWVLELFLIMSFFDQFQAQSDIPPPCSPPDRAALLRFKAGISKDTTGIMSTWAGVDCCGGGWEGVECDMETGRVIRIILQRPVSDGIYMKGNLSSSLSDLPFLEMMVISGMRRLTGIIPPEFAKLTQAKQIILDDNSLVGAIPSELGHLPFLETLSLSGNLLNGQIPSTFGRFKNLLQLNLAKNYLTGSIPSSLSSLRSLESFDLSFNLLNGTIPDFLGNFQNLTYLVLTGNNFTGEIPIPLCSLRKLSELSIDQNLLSGQIPVQIGDLVSVSLIKLGSNKLTGQIPESITRLPNLWNLNLSRNLLTDPIPTNSMTKGLPSLLTIDLSYNGFELRTVPDWIKNRQLSEVRLAGCNLEGVLPYFPKTDSLNALDLSDNLFTNGVSNLLTRMTNLQTLKISNNLLKEDLSAITLPQQLTNLDLNSNHLFGSLSSILGNKTSLFLENIDLSRNHISGSFPAISDGLSIKVLNIGSNNISDQIPSSISNIDKLVRFDISRNRIKGTIPSSLGSLIKLQWLDLSNNELTGKIPESLLGIEELKHANFRSNKFCGEIPQGRPYNVFPAAAYAHNLCLCGKPLSSCNGTKSEKLN